jgi:hypothetical protein
MRALILEADPEMTEEWKRPAAARQLPAMNAGR